MAFPNTHSVYQPGMARALVHVDVELGPLGYRDPRRWSEEVQKFRNEGRKKYNVYVSVFSEGKLVLKSKHRAVVMKVLEGTGHPTTLSRVHPTTLELLASWKRASSDVFVIRVKSRS